MKTSELAGEDLMGAPKASLATTKRSQDIPGPI